MKRNEIMARWINHIDTHHVSLMQAVSAIEGGLTHQQQVEVEAEALALAGSVQDEAVLEAAIRQYLAGDSKRKAFGVDRPGPEECAYCDKNDMRSACPRKDDGNDFTLHLGTADVRRTIRDRERRLQETQGCRLPRP